MKDVICGSAASAKPGTTSKAAASRRKQCIAPMNTKPLKPDRPATP
jgi:hypothetical protein